VDRRAGGGLQVAHRAHCTRPARCLVHSGRFRGNPRFKIAGLRTIVSVSAAASRPDRPPQENGMKPATAPACLLFVVMLSGCAAMSGHPQTAEEFRQAVPGAFLGEVESFEVNRPYRDVAATFREKAPECLHMTVRTTSQTNMSYQVIVTTYNPTVRVGADRAELHLQQHHEAGVLNVTREPEGGYYLLVADAVPVGSTTTRIDLYRPSMNHEVLIKGIKGWAAGDIEGCPDLTRI
jgi:hypothetical protein